MRLLLAIALAAAATGPALAADTMQQAAQKYCTGRWNGLPAAEKAATKQDAFMAGCIKASSGGAMMAMKPSSGGGNMAKPGGK